jgi:hypothetical protein
MSVDHREPESAQQESTQFLPLFQSESACSAEPSEAPSLTSHAVNIKNGKSRREFRWSKTARDLVRANINASGKELSALLTKLVEESGNPRWACRRFVRRMGVKSRRTYRTWTVPEQQRLLKLIDLHPINEVAKLMRRSESSIWHMLYRLGANAKMGKDSFTKYTLAVALHVRPETVETWINRGWLNATGLKAGRGMRVVIQAEDFCEFCRVHTKDVIGNRLTTERLDFVYHFAFPPSHAELLPVRDSKKERDAYEKQIEAQNVGEAA